MSVLTREDVTGMILSATWAGNPEGDRVKIGMSGKYLVCNA